MSSSPQKNKQVTNWIFYRPLSFCHTDEPGLFECWVKLKGEAPQQKQFFQKRLQWRQWWRPARRRCWRWSSSWTSGASRASPPGPCWKVFWKLIRRKDDNINRYVFNQCVQSWCRLNTSFSLFESKWERGRLGLRWGWSLLVWCWAGWSKQGEMNSFGATKGSFLWRDQVTRVTPITIKITPI